MPYFGKGSGIGSPGGFMVPASPEFGRSPVRRPLPRPMSQPMSGGGYSAGDPFAGGVGRGSAALLREGGQYGFFGPAGSQRFRMDQRRRLLTQGRSRRNRAGVLARLSGLDRMGQQQALQEADQDIAGTTASGLNDLDVNEYGANRDFFRGLLRDERGYEERRQRDKEARDAERGSFLGGVGNLAGQAGLAYLTGGASLAIPKAKVRRNPDPGSGGTY